MLITIINNMCGGGGGNGVLGGRIIGDGGDAVGIRDSGYEDALLGKAVLTAYYGQVRYRPMILQYSKILQYYCFFKAVYGTHTTAILQSMLGL